MNNVKKHIKLTNRQAIFVNEIAKGNTQRQACLIAYPKARKWNINSVDVRANALMKDKKVKEALQNTIHIEQNHVLWTKEKATKTILKVMDLAEKEQDNIIEEYKIETDIKQKAIENLKSQWLLADTDKEHLQIEFEILKAEEDLQKHKRKAVMQSKLMQIIFRGIDMLNKMYGIKNIGWENFNIEEEKILTIEELKE